MPWRKNWGSLFLVVPLSAFKSLALLEQSAKFGFFIFGSDHQARQGKYQCRFSVSPSHALFFFLDNYLCAQVQNYYKTCATRSGSISKSHNTRNARTEHCSVSQSGEGAELTMLPQSTCLLSLAKSFGARGWGALCA